jgi:hypothetical protein
MTSLAALAGIQVASIERTNTENPEDGLSVAIRCGEKKSPRRSGQRGKSSGIIVERSGRI